MENQRHHRERKRDKKKEREREAEVIYEQLLCSHILYNGFSKNPKINAVYENPQSVRK
jgi:hypothetical protein